LGDRNAFDLGGSPLKLHSAVENVTAEEVRRLRDNLRSNQPSRCNATVRLLLDLYLQAIHEFKILDRPEAALESADVNLNVLVPVPLSVNDLSSWYPSYARKILHHLAQLRRPDPPHSRDPHLRLTGISGLFQIALTEYERYQKVRSRS
jgi:hypothetical protein